MNGSNFVLDTCVLLAWFHKEPQFITVRKLLFRASKGHVSLYCSEITLMELLYVLLRDFSDTQAHQQLTIIEKLAIDFLPVTRNVFMTAAYFKSRGKISVADTIIAATAKEKDMPLLTKDPEFLALKSEITVKMLG